MHERRHVADEQRQREGVAHNDEEHRQHDIGDRRREDRLFLFEEEGGESPHAAFATIAEARRVRSRNTLSSPGFTSTNSDRAKSRSTIARARSAAVTRPGATSTK